MVDFPCYMADFPCPRNMDAVIWLIFLVLADFPCSRSMDAVVRLIFLVPGVWMLLLYGSFSATHNNASQLLYHG